MSKNTLHVYKTVNAETFEPAFRIIDDVTKVEDIVNMENLNSDHYQELRLLAEQETNPFNYYQEGTEFE